MAGGSRGWKPLSLARRKARRHTVEAAILAASEGGFQPPVGAGAGFLSLALAASTKPLFIRKSSYKFGDIGVYSVERWQKTNL